MGTEFAEVVKYLALSVPKSVCRVMWNSKEKSYMKDIFITQLDSELQTLCSTKNSSVLSESNGEELLQFSLEKFDSELQSKAPITNEVLECLCASSRQKKKKRASGEMSERTIKKTLSVKLMVASMLLNCRCPRLSVLSSRIGLIVRYSGAGRMVSLINKKKLIAFILIIV